MSRLPPFPRPPWPFFVVGALLCTLLPGALTGALDLISLHVVHRPVPVDHHRGHALAQLFGFLFLFVVGVSLHLGPRFLGGRAPSPGLVRGLRWLLGGGLALSLVGRLGALVPGSQALGVVGAGLLLLGVARWAAFIVQLRLEGGAPPDGQARFLVSGALWWTAAALTFTTWAWSQPGGGLLASAPLEPAWALALYGGAGNWLFGVMLRAGPCAMGCERSTLAEQRRAFWAWQAVSAAQLSLAFGAPAAVAAVAHATSALGLAVCLQAVNPLRTSPLKPVIRGPVADALKLAVGFAALWAVLQLGLALGAAGLFVAPRPAHDAARHAFTLGFCTLAVFGFAGRMLPAFEGVTLPGPGLFSAGTATLALAAALRVGLVLSPQGPWRALIGLSGVVGLVGVLFCASCLIRVLRAGRRQRHQARAPEGALAHG